MINLKMHIRGKFLDAYLYAGHLFAIFDDKTVRSINLWKLVFSTGERERKPVLDLAFLQNNWLTNPQGTRLLRVGGVYNAVVRQWRKMSRRNIIAEPAPEDWQIIGNLENLHVQDFRLYGMKIIVGSRHGVFETGLEVDEGKEGVDVFGPFTRVSDIRVTGIAAKAGSLLVSAGTDGLFTGHVGWPRHTTQMLTTPVKPISFRTAWQGYNLINYRSQSDFEYLVNETKAIDKRDFRYAIGDDDGQKVSISKFAVREIPAEQWLEHSNLKLEDISYSFNSGANCFYVLRNGEIYSARIARRQKEVGTRRPILLAKGFDARSNRGVKTYSIQFGGQWLAVEYFDQVKVLMAKRWYLIDSHPAIAVRTFPASHRYGNIILVVNENGISLNSILPPEINPSKSDD